MVKIMATNRKAYYNYEILDSIEAGLVLTGAEIKAIRAGQVSLAGSYARLLISRNLSHPELFWVGGSIIVPVGDPTRSRKLLVRKTELKRLIGKLQEKGLTLVALRLYLKNGRAKLELGLGRGKKLFDKRETIKRKDMARAISRASGGQRARSS